MPKLIAAPTVIEAAGSKPKLIEEYAGRVNSGHDRREHRAHGVARRAGRSRARRPEFEEITVVLSGTAAGSSTTGGRPRGPRRSGGGLPSPGEWVRYGSPLNRKAPSIVAVCLPAFSPDTVHRDDA